MEIEVLLQRDINYIISKLIETGICDDSNFPSIHTNNNNKYVEWTNCHDLSVSLKNLEYDEIYKELNKTRQYHLKLADGALIQLLYETHDDKIISHRLTMFPSRDLESFQNEPELYQSDNIFADILSRNVVTFPIRFDYNRSDIQGHPNSHLSLGQYKNCRIPVYGPIMPKTFINFILKSFYNSFFEDKIKDCFATTCEIEYSIKEEETKHMHIFLSGNA